MSACIRSCPDQDVAELADELRHVEELLEAEQGVPARVADDDL